MTTTFFWFILQCIYFMLPAYVANMSPVIFKKNFLFLAKPIDGNLKFHGKALFGPHKTWRGLLLGIVFGIITAYIQHLINYAPLELIDYSYWLAFGFLMGLGALVGDLVKSFFKRRVGISSGKKFIPFDQIDFVIGALVFSYSFIPRISIAITLLIISPLLHILINHFSYFTGIRKEAW